MAANSQAKIGSTHSAIPAAANDMIKAKGIQCLQELACLPNFNAKVVQTPSLSCAAKMTSGQRPRSRSP